MQYVCGSSPVASTARPTTAPQRYIELSLGATKACGVHGLTTLPRQAAGDTRSALQGLGGLTSCLQQPVVARW